MNSIKGREKFKGFRIILDSRCSSTIIMGGIVEKLHPEKYAVMLWHTQARNITTDLKVKIDITLPTISAPNFVTWECHVYDSTEGRYYMILGRYLLI